MTKKSKEIKEFITEYHDFLAANNIDVTHSTIKGEWFVYQTQEGYGYYEYFIQFTTVAELVDIILDEMKFALYNAVEKEITPPEYDDDTIIGILKNYSPSKDTVPELTTLIDMTLSSEYGKDSRFFQTLDSLFKKSAKNKSLKTE